MTRLKEIESRLRKIDVGEQEKEDLIKEAAALGQRIEVTWENVENKDAYLELLKRYEETGDNEHLIAAFNLAPIALVTCNELYNPKFCPTCGKITEWSTYGYCLTCDNPAKRAIELRTKEYREWTGDEDWEYDAGEYWHLVSKRIYQMVVDGHSVAEVATEFNTTKSNIYSRVRDYCKRNKLETPFKKRKRRPNGLFCLACNRPLVGNQRKWCSNDDCGGWSDLHPRIVRQCSICKNITETYDGSGYETVCRRCSNSPEDAKQRTKEWIAREKSSAKETRERRKRAYEWRTKDVSRECNEDVFFRYLKIDFNREIITPIGKKAEDMFEIVRDVRKAWDLCKPMWTSDVLKTVMGVDSVTMSCPVYAPSLSGPNRISCLLAPLEDWEISVDMYHWWFDMQGDIVTFLTMKFSDWLQRQYVENEREIEEIAKEVQTTVYRIEYALNKLSIPLQPA